MRGKLLRCDIGCCIIIFSFRSSTQAKLSETVWTQGTIVLIAIAPHKENHSPTGWANNYSLIVLLFTCELMDWQLHFWCAWVEGLWWWTRKEIPCKSMRKTDLCQSYAAAASSFFFFFPQKKEVILTHFIKRGGIEKSLCKYTGKNSLHENPFCECVEEKKCLCMKKYIAFIGLQHSLNLSCGS